MAASLYDWRWEMSAQILRGKAGWMFEFRMCGQDDVWASGCNQTETLPQEFTFLINVLSLIAFKTKKLLILGHV